MRSRIRVWAVLVGLCLAGPAVADGRSSGLDTGAPQDINALTIDSDFTLFMGKEVPQDLQRAALRRLWVLMQLPVSCDDLCREPERAATGSVHLAAQ